MRRLGSGETEVALLFTLPFQFNVDKNYSLSIASPGFGAPVKFFSMLQQAPDWQLGHGPPWERKGCQRLF